MSYLRDKSRPQGDRPIYVKQANFGGGLVSDIPASDINNNEVSGLENYIAYERYVEGRPGTVEYSTLPGSGTIHSTILLPNGVYVLHRGTSLWNVTANTEILDYNSTPASLGINTESKLVAYGENAVLYTASGIYLVFVSSNFGTPNKFYQLNSTIPDKKTTDNLATGDYIYGYVVVFSTIVDDATGALETSGDRFTADQTLIQETPPYGGAQLFFARQVQSNPVSSSDTIIVDLTGASMQSNAQDHHSHFSVYRTVDLGPNGLNIWENGSNGVFPLSGVLGAENFYWVGDYDITTSGIIDDKRDTELNQNLILKSAFWEAIPNGTIGDVTETFIFSAERDADKVYYSQRTDLRADIDSLGGFYNPGFQFLKVNDEITELTHTDDSLNIFCEKSMYFSVLTAISTIPNGFANTLNHLTVGDKDLGVKDYGSISEMEQGSFIAVCSDKSIRVWDGSAWSRDLALDKVGDDISQIVEGVSSGVYYKGAYYLWWTDDYSSSVTTKTYRLSIKRSSGKGWTEYTGSDWITDVPKRGITVGKDFLGNVDEQMLFVIDNNAGKIFWAETFDGQDNNTVGDGSSPFKRYYRDKVINGAGGTEIVCKIKTKEATGSRESFNIIHSESHIYPRELTSTITLATLEFDALAFVDGSLASTETAGKVEQGKAIQFWYPVEGNRIAIEFQANRSGHRIVSHDTRYRVQDVNVIGTGPVATDAADFQSDWLNGLQLHLSRPLINQERISGAKLNSATISTQTGPDGRSDAILIGTAGGVSSQYTYGDITLSDAFTVSFYAGPPSNTANVVTITQSGSNTLFRITLTSTQLTLEGIGNITMDAIGANSTSINGYDLISVVRQASSSDIQVYQNSVLKGTLSSSDVFGGSTTQLG